MNIKCFDVVPEYLLFPHKFSNGYQPFEDNWREKECLADLDSGRLVNISTAYGTVLEMAEGGIKSLNEEYDRYKSGCAFSDSLELNTIVAFRFEDSLPYYLLQYMKWFRLNGPADFIICLSAFGGDYFIDTKEQTLRTYSKYSNLLHQVSLEKGVCESISKWLLARMADSKK